VAYVCEEPEYSRPIAVKRLGLLTIVTVDPVIAAYGVSVLDAST
jgi:hypothetical protein